MAAIAAASKAGLGFIAGLGFEPFIDGLGFGLDSGADVAVANTQHK